MAYDLLLTKFQIASRFTSENSILRPALACFSSVLGTGAVQREKKGGQNHEAKAQ